MSTPHMLVYDVATATEKRMAKDGEEHPREWLRSIAIRINKSVWIIQEEDIPHFRLNALERYGVNWFSLPVHTKASEDMLKMLTRELTKQIRTDISAAQANATTASLRAETSGKPAKEVAKGYRYRTNAIVKELGHRLNQYRQAAAKFGIKPESIRFVEARRSAETLRSAILERSQMYVKVAQEIEAREPNSPMAKAMRAGKVPAAIAADYAQDRDIKFAEKLRDMFADS